MENEDPADPSISNWNRRTDPQDVFPTGEVPGTSPLVMSPDEMREVAHMAIELLVSRVGDLRETTAWEGDFKDALNAKLGKPAPEDGRPAKEVLQKAADDILAFATRLDHPRTFAFVPTTPTWPGVVADFLAAGFNVNVCTWLVASGPSELELVVLDWIRNWIGYPDSAGGILTSGGSAASLDALVAARHEAGNPKHPCVYISSEAHTALHRAAIVVGVPRENIRIIPTDEHLRIDMDALRHAVADDRTAGFSPIAVCANAGTTSSGTIDPLEPMADFCEAEDIWLHVDAAYGGFAIITEEGKRLLRGIARADSVCLDAHKWLFQPYEAGCVLVKDARKLELSFAVRPSVLQDTVWGRNHTNLTDRGLQLSRCFRALKIWMSVQTFGMAAFRQAVSNGMNLARRAEKLIRNSRTMEMVNPASLGVVCFRVNPEDAGLKEEEVDEVNRRILARVFWDGRAFMSSTMLRGKFSLRFCILNPTTTWDDVRETLEAIEEFGREALTQTTGPDNTR